MTAEDGAGGRSQPVSAPRTRCHGDDAPLPRRPWTQDTGGGQRAKDAPLTSRAEKLDSEEPGTEQEEEEKGEEKEKEDLAAEDEEEEREKEQKEEEEEEEGGPSWDGGQSRPRAPDGGWGWVVLLATLVVLGLTLGFPSCLGLFYADLRSEFGASNAQVSWVPTVMMGMLHVAGPLCSVCVERFGCRATVMAGGVLSGLGMASGSMARSITDLYITSTLTGLGFSFSLYPSLTTMGRYFVRRRVLANALASVGTALGYSALPLLASFLRAHLGWRGSFLVLGGMLLHCCVCGAVMRPLGPARAVTRPPRGEAGRSAEDRPAVRPVSRLVAGLRRHMAYDLLLSNTRYRAYTVGATWIMLGFAVPQVYLVPYATSQQVDLEHSALLLSIIGLVSLASRPAAALLLGLPCLRRGGGGGGGGCSAYMLGGTLVVNGLSNSLCGAWASFPALALYAVVFGLSQGLVGSLIFTVLMELLEPDDFQPALGLVSLLQGAALLAGPPLAGMLVDATGQYSYVFHACNVAVTSGGLFLLVSFCYLNSGTVDGHRVAREARDAMMAKKKKKPSSSSSSSSSGAHRGPTGASAAPPGV